LLSSFFFFNYQALFVDSMEREREKKNKNKKITQ